MCEDLINLGATPGNTMNYKLPLVNYPSEFIKGIFDGDGCFTYSYSKYGNPDAKIRIVASEEVRLFISSYLNLLGINHSLYEERNMFLVQFGGNIQVEKFMEAIYATTCSSLNRKYIKYKQWKKEYHDRRYSLNSSES